MKKTGTCDGCQIMRMNEKISNRQIMKMERNLHVRVKLQHLRENMKLAGQNAIVAIASAESRHFSLVIQCANGLKAVLHSGRNYCCDS